jgi:hypothetical protein
MASTTAHQRRQTQEAFQVNDADSRALDKSMSTVEAVVTVLIPEFEQVEVETRDGRSLAITEHTKGVPWASLRVGQRLSCRVRGVLTPEVVSASLLA